jgi:hypothetical protein
MSESATNLAYHPDLFAIAYLGLHEVPREQGARLKRIEGEEQLQARSKAWQKIILPATHQHFLNFDFKIIELESKTAFSELHKHIVSGLRVKEATCFLIRGGEAQEQNKSWVLYAGAAEWVSRLVKDFVVCVPVASKDAEDVEAAEAANDAHPVNQKAHSQFDWQEFMTGFLECLDLMTQRAAGFRGKGCRSIGDGLLKIEMWTRTALILEPD